MKKLSQTKRLTRNLAQAVLAAGLICISLSACTPSTDTSNNTANTESELAVGAPKAISAAMPAVPKDLETFYTQTANWEECKKAHSVQKLKSRSTIRIQPKNRLKLR
ncbi:hypothetical protein RQN30_06855 [Arcanobacterium hippocoleae]